MLKPAIAALAAIVAATPAIAQDRTWTGLYLGLHAGHGSGDWDGRLEYDPGLGPVDVFNGKPARSIAGSGWLGGGQVGFNRQLGTVVVGIEVDASRTGIDGDKTFALDPDANTSTDYTWRIKTSLAALGTARARLGLTNGPLLVYATGGVAFARASADLTVTGFPPQGFNPPQVTAVGSATENLIGWTAGGGLEWAFAPAWSVKAEYLYVNLGGAPYRMTGTAYPNQAPCGAGPVSPACSFPHTTDSFPSDLTLHIVRAGINYRF